MSIMYLYTTFVVPEIYRNHSFCNCSENIEQNATLNVFSEKFKGNKIYDKKYYNKKNITYIIYYYEDQQSMALFSILYLHITKTNI